MSFGRTRPYFERQSTRLPRKYQMTDNCQPQPTNSEETEALYSGLPSPEIFVDTVSSLCSYGVTPQVMQGALLQLLQSHFVDPANMLNAFLRRRFTETGAWKPAGSAVPGGLYIASLTDWNPEETETRPALLVKGHQWNWNRLSIGDKAGADVMTGKRYFSGQWTGSHTVFALAKKGDEALVLAVEVAKILRFYSADIVDKIGVSRFMPASVGEIAELAETTETYVVPVTVGYVVPENWALTPDAPRLKRIDWRTSIVLNNY